MIQISPISDDFQVYRLQDRSVSSKCDVEADFEVGLPLANETIFQINLKKIQINN